MEKLEIDLNRIIRSRIGGWKGRLIPGFLISALERLVHQKELNATLDATYPAEGTAFAEAVYKYFDLTLDVRGMENIPDSGRFIFASNHPLGGLDGIGLIKALGSRYGDDGIRFLVNDMLMNVEPLRPVFLPINKYGSQGRKAAKAIADAYASDMQMLIFPAGLVSRLHPDGEIRDLAWQKSFIQKAVEYERDIIPVRFEGLNRNRSYGIVAQASRRENQHRAGHAPRRALCRPRQFISCHIRPACLLGATRRPYRRRRNPGRPRRRNPHHRPHTFTYRDTRGIRAFRTFIRVI